jgi:hypothetical protein
MTQHRCQTNRDGPQFYLSPTLRISVTGSAPVAVALDVISDKESITKLIIIRWLLGTLPAGNLPCGTVDRRIHNNLVTLWLHTRLKRRTGTE